MAMHALPWFSLLLFLLCGELVVIANAQTCATLTSTACSAIIPAGTSIFVPANTTLLAMERFASGVVNLINFRGYPDPCRTQNLQWVCSSWFRPCVIDNGVPIPVPRELCLDRCLTYYNTCLGQPPFAPPTNFPIGFAGYVPFPAKFPLNCSNPPLDYGYAQGNYSFFQDGNYTVEFNNKNYTVPCWQEKDLPAPYQVTCDEPLIVATGSDGLQHCAFTCPLPSLSDSQYDNVKILQGIMGWTSWVATAVFIIMLAFNPKTRSFPRNLVLMVACAANIAAAAIIMPTYAGYKNIWCGGDQVLIPTGTFIKFDSFRLPTYAWNTDETFLSIESSACTFQGAMLQFGFLAAVFWWVLIAFNMALELYASGIVRLELKKWKWLRFCIYLFIGWGIPFVLMVIPASAGFIKFAPGGTYCFVTNEDNYAWSLTFWFLPVGISLLLGVLFFFLALARLVFLLVKLKKLKSLIVINIRLLLFVFLYLALFVFIVAYNITVASNKDAIDSGYSDYYTCVILGKGGCSLPDEVTNYGLVMLKAWAISSLGTLLFFLFMSFDILVFWYQVIRALCLSIWRRDPGIFMQAVNVMFATSSRSVSMTGTSKKSELSITNLAGSDELPVEEEEDSRDKDEEEESVGSSSSD